MPCPECGAENVVIIGTKQQIPEPCKARDKDVILISVTLVSINLCVISRISSSGIP